MTMNTPIRDWIEGLPEADRERIREAVAEDWALLGAAVLALGPIGPPHGANELRALFLRELVRWLSTDEACVLSGGPLNAALEAVAIAAVLRA